MRSNPSGAKASFGVIFDMDGVLVDSADAHLESWRRLAAEQGRTISQDQFRATFGRQNRDILALLFGVTEDRMVKQFSERKEALYRELIRENPPVARGAVQLVRSLTTAGAALAIGSSGPRANIDLVLQAMGVEDAFAAIVSAEDVAHGKPDPEVFERACAALGLPSSRCVVIEDAPAGITAAKAAGTTCVAVLTHHPPEALAGADAIVASLLDLTAASVRALALGTR